MKRLFSIVAIVGLTAIIGFSISIAKNAFRGERLEPVQAEKMWGKTVFSPEAFRLGSSTQRAAMAAEIVNKKIFLGNSVAEVEKVLGRHDAYYKNDFIPAYAMNEGWKTGEDTWQLVFLPDREMKIVEVFIHKNCCEK